MNARTPLSLLPVALSLVVVLAVMVQSGSIAGARAETPTPTLVPSPIPLATSTPGPSPTPSGNICASSLQVTHGGEVIQFGSMEAVLPQGFDYVWIRTGSSSGSTDAAVCVPALNSSIFFSGDSGQETFRNVNNPGANALFSEILNSVHLASCGVLLPRVTGPGPGPAEFPGFKLPAGTFVFSLGLADPGGFGWTTVCYLEGNSEVRISDCREVSRRALRPDAGAVLDQVVAGVSCAPQRTPPPAPVVPIIRPPSSGSAGLKK